MTAAVHAGRSRPQQVWLPAPLLAAALACLGALLGWKGVDLPAHAYRVWLFRTVGLSLWENGWYGGHWTMAYSVLFPPISGLLGLPVTQVLSAALAAWAFDRVVVATFGAQARPGSLVFAVWTTAQVAIGQLPFLLGEALALCALVAIVRRRWLAGALLGTAAALVSALAAAFLLLVLAVWLAADPAQRRRLLTVSVPPAVIITGTGLLFPGQGSMPFRATTLIWVTINTAVMFCFVPPERKAYRGGIALYGLAVLACYFVPSPVGANIVRLGQILGAPLLVCLAWPRLRMLVKAPQRQPLPALALAVLTFGAVVSLALLQWIPALGSFANRDNPSSHAAYYEPLVRYLGAHRQPLGRVEVVPTRLHWEVAFVAPHVALARGWERQIDTAYNPIFYRDDLLDAASYSRWLVDNGVRFVALPKADLDFAGVAEAKLLRAGVPGLRPVWRNTQWQVYEVTRSPGIVSGPATARRVGSDQIVLAATGPGVVDVRIHYSDRWRVTQGAACVRQAADNGLQLVTYKPGTVRLRIGLTARRDATC